MGGLLDRAATPYVELDRSAWARLRESTPMTLGESDLARVRSLGDPVDLTEVTDVYVPLSRLLKLYVAATDNLLTATAKGSDHRVEHIRLRRPRFG